MIFYNKIIMFDAVFNKYKEIYHKLI